MLGIKCILMREQVHKLILSYPNRRSRHTYASPRFHLDFLGLDAQRSRGVPLQGCYQISKQLASCNTDSGTYCFCHLGIVYEVCSVPDIVLIIQLKDSPDSHSLYTRAIRYALARRLATGIPLHTAMARFTIAAPSWVKS